MAIQFQCPECDSEIKVPDSAAGKSGNCPSCRTRLIVPIPEGMAVANAPGAATPQTDQSPSPAAKPTRKTASGGAAESDGSPPRRKVVKKKIIKKVVRKVAPAANGSVATPPAEAESTADNPFAVTESDPTPSSREKKSEANPKRRVVKRRKRSRMTVGIAFPILLLILLAGGIFWWLDRQEDSRALAGTIEGEWVTYPPVKPETVSLRDLEIPNDNGDAILARLEAAPIRIRSNLVIEVVISSNEGGVEFDLIPGSTARYVRFETDAALRDYLDSERDEWSERQRSQRADALERFLDVMSDAALANTTASFEESLDEIRDHLALGSMVGPLGYVVEAKADGQRYPCVYEDTAGRLYFLLPAVTEEFTVTGRKFDDGDTPFNGKYTIEITGDVEGENKPSAINPEDEREEQAPGLGEQLGVEQPANKDDGPGGFSERFKDDDAKMMPEK